MYRAAAALLSAERLFVYNTAAYVPWAPQGAARAGCTATGGASASGWSGARADAGGLIQSERLSANGLAPPHLIRPNGLELVAPGAAACCTPPSRPSRARRTSCSVTILFCWSLAFFPPATTLAGFPAAGVAERSAQCPAELHNSVWIRHKRGREGMREEDGVGEQATRELGWRASADINYRLEAGVGG